MSIEIIENLKNTFKEHDLNLTSTIMSAENGINTLPFLNVEHIFTKAILLKQKTFIHQKFYESHSNKFNLFKWKLILSINTFKGIITGEEKRMKRINEENYESLKKLEIKCMASNFKLKLTEDQLEKIYKKK